MNYYAFASNVRFYFNAMVAKFDDGPLKTNYSTQSIPVNIHMSELQILQTLLEEFKDDKTMLSRDIYYYIYDDFGCEVDWSTIYIDDVDI
ncbi:MAG: hypothetical protein AB9835_01525 [Eubacteriales bacterium]